MKLQETMLNMKVNGHSATTLEQNADEVLTDYDLLGDEHGSANLETPLRHDAFDLSEEEKINQIEAKFADIMQILGLDLNDDSLRGTPRRVAKMYVQEIFQGLNPENKPEARLFENKYRYGQMLVERNITLHSYCEHHFVPIMGKAHVAYLSNGKVIGLSKINRLVRYFAKRPQVQERLTEQIAAELKLVLETEDVAVIIDAYHMCVSTRGIEDSSSSTVTAHYSGKFKTESYRQEFFNHVNQGKR